MNQARLIVDHAILWTQHKEDRHAIDKRLEILENAAAGRVAIHP